MSDYNLLQTGTNEQLSSKLLNYFQYFQLDAANPLAVTL